MRARERRLAVWALAVLSTLAPAAADGNIGCLFSPSLCAKGVEWCYDDVAFGKCIPIYEDQPEDSSLFQYNMSSEELESFEEALQKLLSLGYRWENAYTQCVLQAMLYSSRQHLKTVNMKICDQFSDPDIVSEAKEGGDDEVEPEEVAYVRFTPNDSPVSDSDFANEVYAPPLTDADPPGATHEASYFAGDGSDQHPDEESTRLEYTDKLRDLLSLREGDPVGQYGFDELRGELPPGGFDDPRALDADASADLSDDYIRGSGKSKKSLDPGANGFDEEGEETDEIPAADRTLASLRKLEAGDAAPHTSEYITSNRFTPMEAQVLSSTMQRYRERFRAKQFPFEYEEESNELPESRVYVDEDDAGAEPPLDSGSGHYDPYKFLLQDDDLTETEKSKNMDYLMALWKNDMLRGNKPLEALYAEGGPLIMERATGNTKYLSDEDFHGILSNYDWGFKRRERLDVKKPGPRLDVQALMFKYKKNVTEATQPHTTPVKKENHQNNEFKVDPSFTYVFFSDEYPKTDWNRGKTIINKIGQLLGLKEKDLSHYRVDPGEVTFKVEKNSKNFSAEDVAVNINTISGRLAEDLGITVLKTGVGDKMKGPGILRAEQQSFLSNRENILAMLLASGVVVVVAGAVIVVLVRRDAAARRKLAGLASAADIDAEATQDYQELCRARMTGGKWSGQQTCAASGAVCGGDAPQRVASLTRDQDNNSPSARSSTSSWSEEPALTNMDISTGHMVLAYMEDHLKNKDRLEQEWAALCAYEAEPSSTTAAHADENLNKNRCADVVPYDHSRVTLNTLTNHLASDYINASTITDHDPRNPAYIAAQGPLPHTAPDFWQMVWEQGSVVMVMLTRLTENGAQQCHRYWPEEASDLYHIYEVHLVSEHIWCDDYLVRSFYLKNQRTGETRTVTQFHFLSWPDAGVPASTKALLEFRRKVNKSYRGRSCPIVVHCSDGASRTGTYCLIDMVLNRMAKGAKEIDIAATLEHIRDQRPRMVSTKQQFEFVLMAVAEEVHAILKALPAQLQQQHEKKEKDSVGTDKDKAN